MTVGVKSGWAGGPAAWSRRHTGLAAAQSVPGHWIRSFEWTDEPATSQGATIGNPAPDVTGNPVWRYAWTEGGPVP
ncbi:MAG: hypothetical protein AAF726_09005 [Planctomycetota bacterium]